MNRETRNASKIEEVCDEIEQAEAGQKISSRESWMKYIEKTSCCIIIVFSLNQKHWCKPKFNF